MCYNITKKYPEVCMKRVITFLLCVILLAGCSAEQQAVAPEPSEASTVIPTEAVPEPTATPEITPEPEPEPDIDTFRAQGVAGILGLIPQGFLIDIPMNEIQGAEAGSYDESCAVSFEWVSPDKSSKDVAALLSEKLPYELVRTEDDWRNPEGAESPGIRVNQSENGITIKYILDRTETASTLLTDSFPLEGFAGLPDVFNPAAADRSVKYNDVRAIWDYEMVWRFDAQQGEAAAESLIDAYASKEGYVEEEKNGQIQRSYQISDNEWLRFSWMEQEDFLINVTYEYRMPGHLQSEPMQTLLNGTPAVLLSDLPETFLDILSTNGVSIYYSPADSYLCYTVKTEDNEDHQAIADRAAEAVGQALLENDHGGYNYQGEEFRLTIKFGEGTAGWEYEKETDEGFTHPFLHDLFPVSYLPMLPDVIQAEPFAMSTGYSKTQEGIIVEMARTWAFEDEAAVKEVIETLEAALQDYPGLRTDHQNIECMIKEYSFSCRSSEKEGQWVLDLEFRYSE
jgi:hypothetical protein